MIVDQVNVAGGICFFFVSENQAPVSGHSEAPEFSHFAFERVKPPSRKPTYLVELVSGFEREQKFGAACRPSRSARPWRCLLDGVAEALYGESGLTASHPFMIFSMYG
jgi:hypothetical protein